MTKRALIMLLMHVLVFGPACMAFAENPGTHHSPSTEAPAQFKTIDGMLLKIEGQSYLLLDRAGKENQIHVDKSTKRLGGEKRPGDMIRAQITENGYALSIQ
jgi:hypothetical protein